MEKLDNFDGNGHGRNTNTNHFAPLFKPDNDEGTKQRSKPNTIIVVLSEYWEEKNKGEQNEGNEEDEENRQKKTTEKIDNSDSDAELNGYFGVT